MPRPLPHERFGRHLRPEDEPTHSELFDALMELRDRMGRIEDELRRLK